MSIVGVLGVSDCAIDYSITSGLTTLFCVSGNI